MLTNKKSFNYSGSFSPDVGCPQFFSSCGMRVTIVVENGAKTALIVKKLAHP